MKKKILFIMPSMFIGGAERSLLGLLDTFNYEKYDVSLFMYRHEGEFYKYIPKQVRIIPAIKAYATFDVPIVSLLKSSNWRFGMARIIGKFRLKKKKKIHGENLGIWASMQYTAMSLEKLLPNIPGQYDLAISFLGIPNILLSKVNAKKKIAWNHTDYSILGPDKEYDRTLYSQLDYIVSVSKHCTNRFLNVYQEFTDKAITIENTLSKRLLEEQANEPIQDMKKADEEIILLSVGRFSDAKNFDNVPDICRRIREHGINAKWYLIGYGGDEALIRQRIGEAEMQNYVKILGKKENPYPYIKACDLYVQPSRYEGKCVTVREAQLLGKPVVITCYGTSASQLEDGVDGVIVPIDNECCAEGIVALLRDKKLQSQLIENCLKRDYTNASETDKIYSIVG